MSKKTAWVLLGAVAIAAVIPFTVSGFLVRQGTEIFMYAILASALNIIAGYTGYAAFGNMVFFGIGAYTAAILMTKAHFPFAFAFAGAGVTAVLGAILLGMLLLRLKGQYFALGTTGAMLAVRHIVDIWSEVTGGTQGISLPRLPGTPAFANGFFYFFMLALLLLTIFFVSHLHVNRMGYGFKAIRANEEAAGVMGIDTTRYKILAWSLSALFTGLTGAVYAYWFSYIESRTVFDILWVTNMFVMIIIGGMGTVWGPVVGAFLVQGVSRFFWSRYMTLHMGIMGSIIIFAVLCIPNGILRVRRPWEVLKAFLRGKGRLPGTTGGVPAPAVATPSASGDAVNISGRATDTAGHAPDTAGSATDTAGSALDTAGSALDTAGSALDTAGHALDTSRRAVNTAGSALDTAGHAPDTAEDATDPGRSYLPTPPAPLPTGEGGRPGASKGGGGDPAAAPRVLLRGTGVTRHFGALKAVTDIDFTVNQGEILGIIGPNGAGKTTFLSLINGTLPLTRGEIFFKEEKISGLKPYQIAERGISRTFQIVKPFPGMTVLENVAIGALFGKEHCKDARRAREKTRDILARVHLEGKDDQAVESLNISERKRLELARALAMNPEVLLLDEVMAGLNHTEVEGIMELILDLNRQGCTILVIEHVMKAIMGLSHRVMVLHHGEKIAEGDPVAVTQDEQVITAYLGQRYSQARSSEEKNG